jgi:phospholipid/cholesterol/gamma-HCH transport system ATP-binding protein
MSIISVRNLVVEYGGRRVLDGLNQEIEAGETMVLLGGSGAGKTTLLRNLLGLECPQSGSVVVKGVDITRCSPTELKRVRPSILKSWSLMNLPPASTRLWRRNWTSSFFF